MEYWKPTTPPGFHKVQLRAGDRETGRKRHQWILDNINGKHSNECWNVSYYGEKVCAYYFELEDDAMRFKLAWV